MGSQFCTAVIVGFIAFQAASEPDPADLVARLGATKFADREKAGEDLVKLGRRAIPALKKASASNDPEIRRRAEPLITRIEAAEVLEPTRLTLDIRDRPVAEAVTAIEKASGMRLRAAVIGQRPGVEPDWPPGRITLQVPEPARFWDVVDRLCEAATLRREFLPDGANIFPFEPPFFGLRLVPGKGRPPTFDTGTFRVELLRVHHRRARVYTDESDPVPFFIRGPAPSRDRATGVLESSSYEAELAISVEPRLRIFMVGDIVSAVADDAEGQSLLKKLSPEEESRQLALRQANPHLDPEIQPQLRYGQGTRRSASSRLISLPLSYPSPPAQRIAQLRGVIPLVVVGRCPDPLVVALKDAEGKQFSNGTNKITVHKIERRSGRQQTVEFTLETPEATSGETMVACDAKGTRFSVRNPLDLMELRLEVIDSQGRGLFWQFARAPGKRTEGRMAIIIHGRNMQELHDDNLRLRYWNMIAAAADVPFAFKDVPTP